MDRRLSQGTARCGDILASLPPDTLCCLLRSLTSLPSSRSRLPKSEAPALLEQIVGKPPLHPVILSRRLAEGTGHV